MTNGATGSHPEHESHAWTIEIPDHAPRADTPEYVKSRKRMNELAKALPGFMYGDAPYQDHHGGGLWLKDAQGWFLVRNLAGIEWSAQFCADPAKVDLLRLNAKRIYAAFPDAVAELGIQDLLDTPITDADGVARWTDSICNASVPLPAAVHTGVVPPAVTGGVHHYPAPITDIDLFKRDDFTLWVTTPDGGLAALVPLAPPGSGDGRTRVLLAAVPPPAAQASPISQLVGPAAPTGTMLLAPGLEEHESEILAADNPLSLAAFSASSGHPRIGRRRQRHHVAPTRTPRRAVQSFGSHSRFCSSAQAFRFDRAWPPAHQTPRHRHRPAPHQRAPEMPRATVRRCGRAAERAPIDGIAAAREGMGRR